jgi:hypothetical protein
VLNALAGIHEPGAGPRSSIAKKRRAEGAPTFDPRGGSRPSPGARARGADRRAKPGPGLNEALNRLPGAGRGDFLSYLIIIFRR